MINKNIRALYGFVLSKARGTYYQFSGFKSLGYDRVKKAWVIECYWFRLTDRKLLKDEWWL